MLHRAVHLAVFAVLWSLSAAFAVASPTITSKPDAAEAKFVADAQADIGKRFATVEAAAAAGYVRYTDADDTGAISYANMQWRSSDVHHPSQLWYDKAGKLLGDDYSVPATGQVRPKLWGIEPSRWNQLDGHVHFVLKDPKTGKLAYDRYVMDSDFKSAGGDLTHPEAATLVKLHKAAAIDDVHLVFHFPKIWDLTMWIKPNPRGAFADKNPLVTP